MSNIDNVKLVELIRLHPEMNNGELARRFNVTRQAIKYRRKLLVQRGIITATKLKNGRPYALTQYDLIEIMNPEQPSTYQKVKDHIRQAAQLSLEGTIAMLKEQLAELEKQKEQILNGGVPGIAQLSPIGEDNGPDNITSGVGILNIYSTPPLPCKQNQTLLYTYQGNIYLL